MLDRIANVVPYVAFLVALFFVELQLFGVEDALLGVIFQSFARTMVESAGLSFVNYLKHAALFLVMSLCSSLAGLHPVLLVAGSAVYMFCITLMNSDDYLLEISSCWVWASCCWRSILFLRMRYRCAWWQPCLLLPVLPR